MLRRSVHSHPAIDLEAWVSAHPNDSRVLIADGPSITVTVRTGQLHITDGPTSDKRTRRIARVPRRYDRIVIASGHGYITLDALRWLSETGTHWATIILDELTGVAAPRRTDARFIRAQASATKGFVGFDLARHLLVAKLAGQAKVVADRFGDERSANFIRSQQNGIRRAESFDELRGIEAMAATEYFSQWVNNVTPTYRVPRGVRPPKHWLRYPGRASYAYDSVTQNRSATDPINALLNYAYKVAEAEAVHLCHALGLHPGMGVLHADRADRDSLAVDLLEVARPACDQIVLDILAEPVDIRCLSESTSGVVRLHPPLTHRVIGEAITFGRVMAPHAEYVARVIAEDVKGYRVPTRKRARL